MQESNDPEGLRIFYYLIQDLKCLVFSLITLHFKVRISSYYVARVLEDVPRFRCVPSRGSYVCARRPLEASEELSSESQQIFWSEAVDLSRSEERKLSAVLLNASCWPVPLVMHREKGCLSLRRRYRLDLFHASNPVSDPTNSVKVTAEDSQRDLQTVRLERGGRRLGYHIAIHFLDLSWPCFVKSVLQHNVKPRAWKPRIVPLSTGGANVPRATPGTLSTPQGLARDFALKCASKAIGVSAADSIRREPVPPVV